MEKTDKIRECICVKNNYFSVSFQAEFHRNCEPCLQNSTISTRYI